MTDIDIVEDVPERNSKLFYAIADLIEEFPHMHNQQRFSSAEKGYDGAQRNIITDFLVPGQTEPIVCGTTQCIAGWAIVLNNEAQVTPEGLDVNNPTHQGDWEEVGARLLGLTGEEAEMIFYTFDQKLDWPALLREIGDGAEVFSTIVTFKQNARI